MVTTKTGRVIYSLQISTKLKGSLYSIYHAVRRCLSDNFTLSRPVVLKIVTHTWGGNSALMTRNQWSPPQTASHTSTSAPVKSYCPQACLALFQSSRLIRAKITSDQPDKYLLTMWYCTRSPSWENAFGDTSKSSQGVVNSDVSVPGGSEVLKLWLSAYQSPQPTLGEILLIAYKWCSCI